MKDLVADWAIDHISTQIFVIGGRDNQHAPRANKIGERVAHLIQLCVEDVLKHLKGCYCIIGLSVRASLTTEEPGKPP